MDVQSVKLRPLSSYAFNFVHDTLKVSWSTTSFMILGDSIIYVPRSRPFHVFVLTRAVVMASSTM